MVINMGEFIGLSTIVVIFWIGVTKHYWSSISTSRDKRIWCPHANSRQGGRYFYSSVKNAWITDSNTWIVTSVLHFFLNYMNYIQPPKNYAKSPSHHETFWHISHCDQQQAWQLFHNMPGIIAPPNPLSRAHHLSNVVPYPHTLAFLAHSPIQ